MRLQHGGGEALYREWLQAATHPSILSGFRKSGDFIALLRPKVVQNLVASGLRLAHATAATCAISGAAIGLYGDGGYQSTHEKDSGSNNQ